MVCGRCEGTEMAEDSRDGVRIKGGLVDVEMSCRERSTCSDVCFATGLMRRLIK